MTPSIPSSDLFRLQGQLFEMMAEREELYAQLASNRAIVIPVNATAHEEREIVQDGHDIEAEIKALESGIGSFLLDRIRSVDDIRNPLLAMQAARQVCEAEAQRATNQALKWQRQIETVLDLVKHCMKHLDEIGTWKPKESRKLQSALGSIMLVNNGGKQPVEITDEALVPDEFCRVSISMTVMQWAMIVDFIPPEHMPSPVKLGPREPIKSAIEAELNKPCEECEGAGEKCVNPDEHTRHTDCTDRCHTCQYCGGTGKRGVPGARLAERGEHIRISGLTK